MVSLAIGLYEDIAVPEYDSQGNKIPGVKWVEGVAIIVAITIVVLAGSINDFQKEKQFRKLNAKKEDRQIKVPQMKNMLCIVNNRCSPFSRKNQGYAPRRSLHGVSARDSSRRRDPFGTGR